MDHTQAVLAKHTPKISSKKGFFWWLPCFDLRNPTIIGCDHCLLGELDLLANDEDRTGVLLLF